MSIRLSRRTVLQAVPAASLLAGNASVAAASRALRIVGPQCCGLTDPLGVHESAVRLSWRLESPARGVVQTGYRIEVASSAETLAAGQADLWDSGRVATDQCFDVAYRGTALASRQRAWWRVTVSDNLGNRATSAPAFWEMGLLRPADWQAEWIAAETEVDRADRDAGLFWIHGPGAGLAGRTGFRLSFTLDDVADVSLIVAANAKGIPYIDGTALPALAPKDWHPFAVTHDVRLPRGRHSLCVALDERVAKLAFLGEGIGCALLVRARYADGRTAHFNGLQTRTAVAPAAGWLAPAFDDAGWAPAERADTAQMPFASTGGALLRREFPVARSVTSARLYVTALGAHETYLNGQRVGDGVLAPEWTNFAKRVLYRAHDVTALVREGPNAIGAMVGDGWYGSRILSTGRFSFGAAPLRYLAQLEITYADGSRQIVSTGDAWSVGRSPIVFCDIYDGEDYDARLEEPGWSSPGFAGNWNSARVAPPATGALEGHVSPPIRRAAALKTRTITAVNGTHVVDFGQNFSGFVRIRVKGRAGDRVTLKFAEILRPDGSIDSSNLRSARASDSYTLRGDPKGELFEPRFTYHGFRYVEVSGLPSPPRPADLTGILLHSDLAETGHLRVGNALIMKMWQNNLWSQRSNFMGLPTDCPQRDERMGWLGDANVFWDAAAFNMDVAAFTRRWMGDLRNSQTAEGVIPEISPTTWGASGQRGATPGWADAGVMLPWTVWKRYGDTSIIDQNWELMTRYLRFVAVTNPAHLWSVRRGSDYADWLAFDAKEPGDPTTPKDLVGTAMWKRSSDAMAEMARATGRTVEADGHARTSSAIRDAFIKAYVHADGTIGNDSQTSYILALAFDLVPKEARPAAARRLHDNIVRRGGHLTTGFLGTPFSLDVLADAGYASTVYDLLLRTAYPSWGYMVARGATTTWERWNGDAGDVSMNSFNHYALGAINGFVYRRIAGIAALEPGFRRFRVAPLLDPRVTSGGASYDSVLGRISTSWSVDTRRILKLRVSVPANAHAIIVLPTDAAQKVTESGRALDTVQNLSVVGSEAGRLLVEVGSGEFEFSNAIL